MASMNNSVDDNSTDPHLLEQEARSVHHLQSTQCISNKAAPPNLRSILKSATHQSSVTEKKKLSVRFNVTTVGPSQIEAANRMQQNALSSLRKLILMWAKQAANSYYPASNYKNRLVVNFQPGMTPRYLKYLITSYVEDLPINEYDSSDSNIIDEQKRQDINSFIHRFADRATQIFIANNASLNELDSKLSDTTPSIIILEVEDLRNEDINSEIGQFITRCITGPHSLIIFSTPICGFDYRTIEKRLNVKVRQLWLPRLDHPKKYESSVSVLFDASNVLCSGGSDYDFSSEYIKECHGIPKVMEVHEKDGKYFSATNTIYDLMTLWTEPEFKPYIGHFYTLNSLARSHAPLYTSAKISAKMNTVNAAAVLGFNVILTDVKQDSSNRPSQELPSLSFELPYSIGAIDWITYEFDRYHSDFDVFKLVHGNARKRYEALHAVTHALVTGSKNDRSFGRQWPFFKDTFIDNVNVKLSLQPQVIPKVQFNGRSLDTDALPPWTQGERISPPQHAMNRAGLSTLIERGYLARDRVIIPVETSLSPDIMFLIQQGTFYSATRSERLLCVTVKTGVQDLSLPYFQEEVAKSPFLGISQGGQIVRIPDTPHMHITFLYIAPVHSAINRALTKEAVVYQKGQEGLTKDAAVVKYDERIHVRTGSKVLSLPQDVEVIILLRRGLESLFGTEDYHSLLDSACEPWS